MMMLQHHIICASETNMQFFIGVILHVLEGVLYESGSTITRGKDTVSESI